MLAFCSFSTEAASIINKVVYQGNEVTQPAVLDREIYIGPGDEVNAGLIEKSRQAIMDLGLFKSVYYFLQKKNTHKTDDTELYDVVFVVEEKYYILLFPRLKLDDGKYNFGVQLKWDNVLGLNHETRILAENRGSTANVEEKRYTFRYLYRNINNSVYNVDLNLQTLNDVDESEGAVDRQDDKYKVTVSRWLNIQGRNRGWFAGGSILYQKRFNQDLIVSENSEKTDAIIMGADIGYSNLSNFEYNRGGKSYGYRLDWSDKAMGSKSVFTRHRFYYRSYYQLDNNKASNLNVQMQFGHSNEKVLGEYAFSLGSSADLRGYDNSRFNGNTMFLTNIEYMQPIFNRPALRYVTFIDIGNTYDQLSDALHNPLNVGAGVGLRWKIRSLVKIDLRADVAYGFTDEDYKFSFGTRHAF